MAGHSKWANIKRQKEANDKKKGKEFTKLIREITVAAKQGPDKDQNPRLRLAIEKALAQNMNKQTIERAVLKGSGNTDDDKVEAILYEGYGPGGFAIMVECLSDNRNRTVSEVRHAFSKHGGNLGTDGSVSFMFDHKGMIVFDPTSIDELEVFDIALEAGADDVVQTPDNWQIITAKEKLYEVTNQLNSNENILIKDAYLFWLAQNDISIDETQYEKAQKLIQRLEDLDDVQDVYTNINDEGHDHSGN